MQLNVSQSSMREEGEKEVTRDLLRVYLASPRFDSLEIASSSLKITKIVVVLDDGFAEAFRRRSSHCFLELAKDRRYSIFWSALTPNNF